MKLCLLAAVEPTEGKYACSRSHQGGPERGPVPKDGGRFRSPRQVGVEEYRGGHLLWFNPSCENQGMCSPPLECVLLVRGPAAGRDVKAV